MSEIPTLEKSLRDLLNQHGWDARTDTPDFVLANFLVEQLKLYGLVRRQTARLEEPTEPMPGNCPRRTEGGYQPNQDDAWVVDVDYRRCSYCGGVHPDDALRLITAGTHRVEFTDKSYKFYLTQAGVNPVKAYRQHFSVLGWQKLVENAKGYPERARKKREGYPERARKEREGYVECGNCGSHLHDDDGCPAP